MNAPVQITHETDDPICLRASIGGTEETGFYVVYRGDREKVAVMLEHCSKIFNTSLLVPEAAAQPTIKRTRFGSS